MLRTCRTSIDHRRLIRRPHISILSINRPLNCAVRCRQQWHVTTAFPRGALTYRYLPCSRLVQDNNPQTQPPGQKPWNMGFFSGEAFLRTRPMRIQLFFLFFLFPTWKQTLTRTKTPNDVPRTKNPEGQEPSDDRRFSLWVSVQRGGLCAAVHLHTRSLHPGQ